MGFGVVQDLVPWCTPSTMPNTYEVAGITLKRVSESLGGAYRGHVFPFTVNLRVGDVSPTDVEVLVYACGENPWESRNPVTNPDKIFRASFKDPKNPFVTPTAVATGDPLLDTEEEAIQNVLRQAQDYIDDKVQQLQHWSHRAKSIRGN